MNELRKYYFLCNFRVDPDLYKGNTLATFQPLGTTPVPSDKLIINVNGSAIALDE